MEEVKQRIKEHEGFRDTVYSDSLGFATVGYGHLVLPTDDFVEGVAYPEMCFQLGKPRVMKFKKMWEGIEAGDYNKSADEMIDSNWHKQTTSRCESLAELVRSCA